MARRRRNAAPIAPIIPEKLVTPAHGVATSLEPLTFGNFLPQKFQSPENLHAEVEATENTIPLAKSEVPINSTMRRLQFSEVSGKSAVPTAAEVVRGNRDVQMGKVLSFVPPSDRDGKIVVKISEDDLKPQLDYWQTALIGFIIGDNPSERNMDNFVMHVWNLVAKPQVLLHAEGYYIFRFNSIKDRDMVLQSGPYSNRNRPMVLKPWEVDSNFQSDVLSTVPIWIRFPGLPVGYLVY